jgi:hypothetical protein
VIVNRIFALQYQLSTATTSAAAASSGLSTGAKAGIGAGIGVTALAVIIGVTIFLIKHHNRTPPTQASAPPENIQDAAATGPSELHSTAASNKVPPVSYVFKPGFMEADSTPLKTSPHHGHVEVDGAVQPARYELGLNS